MLFKLFRLFVYNLLWILYPLTFIVRRRNHVWVFGSNFNSYNDNARSLFEFVTEHDQNITAVWITGSRNLVKKLRIQGLNAEWRYSLKGMFTVARAGVFIYCHGLTDINMWLKRGAFKFNLWHGVGLKKVGVEIDRGPNRKLYQPANILEHIYARIHSPQLFDISYYMLATSEITKKNYSRSFQIPQERFLIAGYPRLKPLFSSGEKPEHWSSFDKVLIYAPTFRDGNTSFLKKAIPDVQALNIACKNQNILFAFKLHPITPIEEASRFMGYSNLEVIDNRSDIYPALAAAEGLITDYSSIFVDFAILNKPILIYAPDVDEYLKNSRDFYFSFSELTQDKHFQSFEKLLDSIKDLEKNSISNKVLNDIFWETDPTTASSDITHWLKRQLNLLD